MSADRTLPVPSKRAEIDAFLKRAAQLPAAQSARGRLIFGLDATASREPTWAEASGIQQDMFRETQTLGGLAIQLLHYGGLGLEASGWQTDSARLLALMRSVRCRAGHTQIEAVLARALAEHQVRPVGCLVFVGDCIEENHARLFGLAGQMGLRKLPAFLFHEGGDVAAARGFAEIGRLSGGASFPFDAKAPGQLRDLLTAAAMYAAGGAKALAAYAKEKGGAALLLSRSLGGG